MEFIILANPENPAEMDLFQQVAFYVYRNDPIWAPPSEIVWRQRFQHLHKDPANFVMPIVIVDKNQPVARCMFQLIPGAMDEQGYPQGWISFFECRQDFQEVAKGLLAYGEQILLQKGARTVLISKSDNQIVGILTSGFNLPHLVFTNYNPSFYFDLLITSGYVPETKMVTLNFFRDTVKQIHLRLPGLRTREFERANLDQEIEIFHKLQREIFQGRPGYVPRTYEEDSQLVNFLLPFLEDDLIIIAETSSGTPVGLLVCIPDIYQLMRGEETSRARIMSIGAIPDFANKGVGALMGVHLMNNLLKKSKYMFVEGSWILSHNRPPLNLARRFNAMPGKEYWLLKKKLVI